MRLTSPDFEEGAPIPRENTCEGEDISPTLQWADVPERAKSLALICDDPDAPRGTWVHWVMYGLPADVTELVARVPPSAVLPSGAFQGFNDFGKTGYGGPCPPRGSPHRYFFRLYALDAELQVKPPVRKDDLVRAMKGHIIAEASLMGTYRR